MNVIIIWVIVALKNVQWLLVVIPFEMLKLCRVLNGGHTIITSFCFAVFITEISMGFG